MHRIPVRHPVVVEWSERAERHWVMVKLSKDLRASKLTGHFDNAICLETTLRAALIAHSSPLRDCLRRWFSSLPLTR